MFLVLNVVSHCSLDGFFLHYYLGFDRTRAFFFVCITYLVITVEDFTGEVGGFAFPLFCLFLPTDEGMEALARHLPLMYYASWSWMVGVFGGGDLLFIGLHLWCLLLFPPYSTSVFPLLPHILVCLVLCAAGIVGFESGSTFPGSVGLLLVFHKIDYDCLEDGDTFGNKMYDFLLVLLEVLNTT